MHELEALSEINAHAAVIRPSSCPVVVTSLSPQPLLEIESEYSCNGLNLQG